MTAANKVEAALEATSGRLNRFFDALEGGADWLKASWWRLGPALGLGVAAWTAILADAFSRP